MNVSPFENNSKRFTFIFPSEQASHEFLKNSIKEQVDFYQSISNELSQGFIKPNIMFAGFFGWKCNEFLQILSDKAKKLMNPNSQYKVFVLWNRHFIQSSLDLLSKRLHSKIELLTDGYVSQNFKIFTLAHKEQFEQLNDIPILSKNNKQHGNKDLGSRSFESINTSIFVYMDSLIRFLKFLGSPVKSTQLFKSKEASSEGQYSDYTINLEHILHSNLKVF